MSPADSTGLQVTLECWNGTTISPLGIYGSLIFQCRVSRNACRNRELPQSQYSTGFGTIIVFHHENPSRVYIKHGSSTRSKFFAPCRRVVRDIRSIPTCLRRNEQSWDFVTLLDGKIDISTAENLTVAHSAAGSILQFDLSMVYTHEALVF